MKILEKDVIASKKVRVGRGEKGGCNCLQLCGVIYQATVESPGGKTDDYIGLAIFLESDLQDYNPIKGKCILCTRDIFYILFVRCKAFLNYRQEIFHPKSLEKQGGDS